MQVFRQNIEQYDFDENTDIIDRQNLDFAKTKKLFLSLQNKIAANARSNQKTLTVVYYAGHGMMNENQSQIILPDSSKKIPLYNLENRLRAMGQEDNSYVIGIFDCCREAYNEDNFPLVVTRGGDGNEERDEVVETGQNVFLIFGCPSNRGVPATSKIAS